MSSTGRSTVRLHVLRAGSMTSALSGFLAGMDGDITFPVPVYVIEHAQGLVLIDTGMHPDLRSGNDRIKSLASAFNVHLAADGSEQVGAVLGSAGFDPALVSHVILTHLHFDHGGGLLQIPNATVLVQKDEWAGLRDEKLVAIGVYNPADVDLGHQRLELDGDHDVFGDGSVVCLKTSGHTAGHQSVRVRSESGTYVVCGDCCYLRKTVEDEHLPAFSYDADQQLASIRRLAGEQQAGATLIFGHDPEQWAAVEKDGLHPGI